MVDRSSLPRVEVWERWRASLQLIAVLGLLVLVALRDPNQGGSYPICPFRQISGGLLCPGCGSMRALYAVLHGRIFVAFQLNPLGVVFFPLIGWLIVDFLIVAIWGKRLPRLRASSGIIWLLVAVIIGYTAVRNAFPWLTTADAPRGVIVKLIDDPQLL